MKKFISGLLIGSLLMLCLGAMAADIKFTAVKSAYSINLFGRSITLDKPVVVIGGTQYVPVQKFSAALSLTYKEDAKTKKITIGKLPKSQLIVFKNTSYYTEGEYTYVNGEAENKDTAERTPRISVVFYNTDKTVMITDTTYVQDLAPGETKAFKFMIFKAVPEETPYKLQVDSID
jgi:hypothetical protein